MSQPISPAESGDRRCGVCKSVISELDIHVVCDKCDRLFHSCCTSLPSYEFVKYLKTKRKYTCETCMYNSYPTDIQNITKHIESHQNQQNSQKHDYEAEMEKLKKKHMREREDLLKSIETYELQMKENDKEIRELKADIIQTRFAEINATREETNQCEEIEDDENEVTDDDDTNKDDAIEDIDNSLKEINLKIRKISDNIDEMHSTVKALHEDRFRTVQLSPPNARYASFLPASALRDQPLRNEQQTHRQIQADNKTQQEEVHQTSQRRHQNPERLKSCYICGRRGHISWYCWYNTNRYVARPIVHQRPIIYRRNRQNFRHYEWTNERRIPRNRYYGQRTNGRPHQQNYENRNFQWQDNQFNDRNRHAAPNHQEQPNNHYRTHDDRHAYYSPRNNYDNNQYF